MTSTEEDNAREEHEYGEGDGDDEQGEAWETPTESTTDGRWIRCNCQLYAADLTEGRSDPMAGVSEVHQ